MFLNPNAHYWFILFSPSEVSGTKARLLTEWTLVLWRSRLSPPHPIPPPDLSSEYSLSLTAGRTIHPSADQNFCPYILLLVLLMSPKIRSGFLKNKPKTQWHSCPLRVSVAWLTKVWRARVQSSWKGAGEALNYLMFLKAWLPPLQVWPWPLFFHYLPHLVPGTFLTLLALASSRTKVCRGILSGAFSFSRLTALSLPKPRSLPQPVQQTGPFSWVHPG